MPVSASARRFREFVNPRSIAENLIDELKRPRPDASDLTTSTTSLTVAARLQPPTGAAPEDTPFSQEETSELDLAPGGDARSIKVVLAAEAPDGGPAAAAPRVVEVRRTVSQDQAPGGRTWLQLIFVTWGGILTLASAVRLFLG